MKRKQAESLHRRAFMPDNPSPMIRDDVSVVIPTLGRPILQQCLLAISKGTVLPARVIVVDQGDNSLVAGWLRDLEISGSKTIHLPSADKGPASARNEGIARVQTPFVAAIDDDCIAERGWLENLGIRLHQNPEVIITGRVEPTGEGRAPTIVTSASSRMYHRPSVRQLSPMTSGNMGFALRTAHRIGPFDRHLFTAEDNDWAYRALRAGIPILYAPEVIVYHFHWRDEPQLAMAYRDYAWGQGAFYGKHLRQGDWSMIARTALSLFRGARDYFYGLASHDANRQMNGLARVTRLLPGLFSGLRGFGSP